MLRVINGWNRIFVSDHGATAVEYAIMVSLIAVAVIGVVALLGGSLTNLFRNVADTMPTGSP